MIWLLIPIGVFAYHFGPGQTHLKLDAATQLLREADNFVAESDWVNAQERYESALALLPPEQSAVRQRARLELCKAQMQNKQLPTANQELESLLNEVVAQDPSQLEPGFADEVRAAYANSQYFITWLMRLEGQPRDLWEKEIESAQSIFRYLAKTAEEQQNTELLEISKLDLESCVKLARMDLGELQGLPLPSQ
jgi:hypothetical protein